MAELNGPCANCPAKCCRNYSVSLTKQDIIRLKEKTDIDQFIVLENAEGFDQKLAPSFLLEMDRKIGKYILRLRRDNKETCVFLGKNNFCLIYENRPRKCRTYPFLKTIDEKLDYKEGHRCPVDWKLSKTIQKSFEKDIEEQEKEIEEFSRICKKWNSEFAGKRTLENFLEFIMCKNETTD